MRSFLACTWVLHLSLLSDNDDSVKLNTYGTTQARANSLIILNGMLLVMIGHPKLVQSGIMLTRCFRPPIFHIS